MAISFYVLDLETTGLLSTTHEITELSLIRVADRVQLTRQVRVNHPENASYDALKITGKTMNDLKKGISPEQLIRDVDEFLARDGSAKTHRSIIGHNAINFDLKFIHRLYDNYNKTFQADMWVDTLHMSR